MPVLYSTFFFFHFVFFLWRHQIVDEEGKMRDDDDDDERRTRIRRGGQTLISALKISRDTYKLRNITSSSSSIARKTPQQTAAIKPM